MASPSLIIRRVKVEGDLSCDFQFDSGLNIIQAIPTGNDPTSTHKCGKTALVELIQHGLGRRHQSKAKFHFAPILDEIKRLWLEIEINGESLTIERSLQEITGKILLREGSYTPGIETVPPEMIPVDEFSAVLLSMLRIPEVSVKTANADRLPLSFPTLMRAFVLHQEDSFGAILDKMIPEQRRADVIGFLSGITPVERFYIEDKLAEVQQEAQALENYFRSIQEFLSKNAVPTLIEASGRVEKAQAAVLGATEAQRALQLQIRAETVSHEPEQQKGRIDKLSQQLFAIKEETRKLEHSVLGLGQEEERLKEVIASLETDLKKSQRLKSSTTILSSVEFSICPRCLLDITEEMRQREHHARCSLCNRPVRTTSDTPPKAAPKTDDIDLQISEAKTILHDLHLEFDEVNRRLTQLKKKEQGISALIDQESNAYVSPAVDYLLARAYEVAQKEAELAKAQSLFQQAEALEAVRIDLNVIKDRQAQLEDQLREVRKPNKQRLNELRQLYEQILRHIDFPDFRECSIDSQTLMPYINRDLYMHVGMALKGLATVAYHLALLELSRHHDTFFPRLLVVDSPAIGDLNEVSHDKLLRYFATLATNEDQHEGEEESVASTWQIILTTRRLVPELIPFVKATISSPDKKLLRRSPQINESA